MGYVLVEYMINFNGKRKPNFYFGGYNEKYSGMINITIKDCAYVFNSKEKAMKTAKSLNNAGYDFEVEQRAVG